MELKKLPNHIGFIVDGNGRWAKKRKLNRTMGHKFGVEAVKKIISALLDLNIKYSSFFVFSTENFKRSKEEVDNIFDLLREYIKTDLEEFNKKGIRLVISGDITKLPKDLQINLQDCLERTKNNDNLIVNMCLNYGGQQEIVRACNKIIEDKLEKVNEKTFKNYLYSSELPSLDLVIRTSGELRISNFMLYDLAYAEFYFTKTYWPSFDKKGLLKALKEYQKRDRRFGKA